MTIPHEMEKQPRIAATPTEPNPRCSASVHRLISRPGVKGKGGWRVSFSHSIAAVAAAGIFAGALCSARADVAADTCIGIAAPSYPTVSEFTMIGSVVHVRVTLGAGPTRNTNHIIINRWRFNLDC